MVHGRQDSPHGPAGHRTAWSSTSVYRRFRIRAQRHGVLYIGTDRRTGGRHIMPYIHSTVIGMNRVNGGQLAGNEGEGWGREAAQMGGEVVALYESSRRGRSVSPHYILGPINAGRAQARAYSELPRIV